MKKLLLIILLSFAPTIFACPEGLICRPTQVCESSYQGSICYEVREKGLIDEIKENLSKIHWYRAFVAAIQMAGIILGICFAYLVGCYLYGCFLYMKSKT